MKRLTLGVGILCCLLAIVACSQKTRQMETPEYDKGINIIPLPKELTETGESFTLDSKTKIIVAAEELKPIAEFLAGKLQASADLSPEILIGDEPTANSIYIGVDPTLTLKEEGYTLQSGKKGVIIKGKSAHGAFYGMQSLLQLLPAEVESPKEVALTWEIPGVDIQDEPRFGYRGFMLDVCRHFLSVDEVKKHIDMMAMFKINRFHWHLTEDQAWRIEIKKYPRLTEVGGTRTEGDGTEYAGFYTQDEVREVVRYAAERFITVIPEIELPG
ncbi:beta-N-acetylhexosaminidase, partial [Bacteroides heparinolyticus]|uniref:beta-N-acetylhexosaminidase n=1 Tax=Prevotella heparinolytica TaxID=28113 RepID=UPI0035A02B66